MTAVAALVAEAIAASEQRCEAHISNYAGSPFVPQTMHSHGIRYHRADVVDAALTHLATRAAEAAGRAERAEARIVKLRATLDAAAQASGANAVIDLCDNALCVDILDADQPDADAAVPRG